MEFLQLASNGFSAAPVRRAKPAADGGAGSAGSHEAVDPETAKARAAMAPEEKVLHEWADEFAQVTLTPTLTLTLTPTLTLTLTLTR